MPVVGVYLDECVNHAVIPFLHLRGWRITTAQEQGMSNATDDDQLRYATRNSWLLLTTNERHFGSWHTIFLENGWPHGGIVAIPQRHSPRFFLRSAMMLDWIATGFPNPRNQLFRWTDLQQHLNRGSLLPGYTAEEIALALGRTP